MARIGGSFVGTTNIWDVSEIYSTDINSDEFKELLVRLYQNINTISVVLNMKTSGNYDLNEFITGNNFFPNPNLTSASTTRPVARGEFRKVINFGALPSTATKSVAHGITFNASTIFTGLYATSSDTTGINYIPIPYASSTAADVVRLDVDGTNVKITTGKDMTAYDNTIVVMTYLKN